MTKTFPFISLWASCPRVYAIALMAILSGGAAAQVTVDAPPDSPNLNLFVNAPFYLQAEAPTCQSQPVTTMAYSIDNDSPDAYTVKATSLQALVTGISNGPHVIHVKAWNGIGNEVCTQSITLTVGGGLNVSTPAQGTQGVWTTVQSPFPLQESASTCGGAPTTSMTYSLDNVSGPPPVSGTSLNTTVSASLGSHILRGKAWGSSGEYCETDIRLNVSNSPPGIQPPSNATVCAHLENDNNGSPGGSCKGANPNANVWQTQPDSGTGGTKSGSTSLVSSPVYGGQSDSRQFSMTFTNGGKTTTRPGVRWFDKAIADTPSARHFIYDAYVYIAPGSNLDDIELDINHAIGSSGQVYILGAQCDLVSGNWQVSIETQVPKWVNTNASCSASQVTAGVWHHFQIQTSHDAEPGQNIYYEAVALDGNVTPITTCKNQTTGATVACQSTSTNLGWAGLIGPNFQLDGNGELSSGAATAYVDNFTIYYW